jgi:hypothetical protein
MPLAETAWRNGDADTDREAPFGGRDHLAWVARHFGTSFLVCGGLGSPMNSAWNI